LSLPSPDSAGTDSMPGSRDSSGASTGSREGAEYAAHKTFVRVLALRDSVLLRVLPAGERERTIFLRLNKPQDFTHDDAITFITKRSGIVRLFLKDSSMIPTERRFKVDGNQLVEEEEIFSHLGRIRDIRTGPDGYLYIALEQIGATSGWLVRLVPVGNK